MEFNNGKHSISAVFANAQDAKKAQIALNNAGISDVTLNKINRFNIDSNQEETQDVEKTLDSAAEVLMASDPSLSEYNVEEQREKNGFMLTVQTSTSKLNQALKIVQRYGGEI